MAIMNSPAHNRIDACKPTSDCNNPSATMPNTPASLLARPQKPKNSADFCSGENSPTKVRLADWLEPRERPARQPTNRNRCCASQANPKTALIQAVTSGVAQMDTTAATHNSRVSW